MKDEIFSMSITQVFIRVFCNETKIKRVLPLFVGVCPKTVETKRVDDDLKKVVLNRFSDPDGNFPR